jgi:nucleotide-binding universal stress UspA family protein
MYRRFLVPLDGSEQAEAVLTTLLTISVTRLTEIVLLRVAEFPRSIFSAFIGEFPSPDPNLNESIQRKKKAILAQNQQYLKRIASGLKDQGVTTCVEVCPGPVVEAILNTADRYAVDMIVMAASGEGQCASSMIGSTANRVLHEANVPVVLLHPIPSSRSEPYPWAMERSELDAVRQ